MAGSAPLHLPGTDKLADVEQGRKEKTGASPPCHAGPSPVSPTLGSHRTTDARDMFHSLLPFFVFSILRQVRSSTSGLAVNPSSRHPSL